MKPSSLLGLPLVLLLALAGLSAATPQEEDSAEKAAEAARAAVIAEQSPSYPLNSCVVSGEAFTAEDPAQDFVIDGHLVRLCCSRCKSVAEKDPKAVIAKVQRAVVEQQKPLWPLETCPVSGDAFGGEMGEPLDYVVGTRYVKLCCKGCVKAVEKDRGKFFADLDAALIPALRKTYPTEVCVVSDERLGSMGEPIDVMYGHRLLRFCCKGCLRAYKKDPAGLARKVYGQAQAKAKDAPADGEER